MIGGESTVSSLQGVDGAVRTKVRFAHPRRSTRWRSSCGFRQLQASPRAPPYGSLSVSFAGFWIRRTAPNQSAKCSRFFTCWTGKSKWSCLRDLKKLGRGSFVQQHLVGPAS